MTPIRVLVADDHPLFRQGLRRALEFSEGLEIVGEARDGEECLRMVEEIKPDVLLLDLTMPRLTGVEVTRRVKERHPEVGVLILTMHDAEEYLVEAVQAGVDGYALKDIEPGELTRAIETCHRGERYLQHGLSGKLMQGLVRQSRERQQVQPLDVLSDREWTILQELAHGASNREIAEYLHISEKTVKNHASNLFRKLAVEDRTQAVLEAIKRGWVAV